MKQSKLNKTIELIFVIRKLLVCPHENCIHLLHAIGFSLSHSHMYNTDYGVSCALLYMFCVRFAIFYLFSFLFFLSLFIFFFGVFQFYSCLMIRCFIVVGVFAATCVLLLFVFVTFSFAFTFREVRSNFRCAGRRNRLNEIELNVCVFICHSLDKLCDCYCYCRFSFIFFHSFGSFASLLIAFTNNNSM